MTIEEIGATLRAAIRKAKAERMTETLEVLSMKQPAEVPGRIRKLLAERNSLSSQLHDATEEVAALRERLRPWEALDERLLWSKDHGHRFVLTNDAHVSRGSRGDPEVTGTCQCIDCGERWPTYGDLCPMPDCPRASLPAPIAPEPAEQPKAWVPEVGERVLVEAIVRRVQRATGYHQTTIDGVVVYVMQRLMRPCHNPNPLPALPPDSKEGAEPEQPKADGAAMHTWPERNDLTERVAKAIQAAVEGDELTPAREWNGDERPPNVLTEWERDDWRAGAKAAIATIQAEPEAPAPDVERALNFLRQAREDADNADKLELAFRVLDDAIRLALRELDPGSSPGEQLVAPLRARS